jgi:hypothetical protein
MSQCRKETQSDVDDLVQSEIHNVSMNLMNEEPRKTRMNLNKPEDLKGKLYLKEKEIQYAKVNL